MSTNHEQNGEDELQGARRTAYALGQAEGAEKAAVEGEMAASPQTRQEVEAVEALAARLKEAAQAGPPPEPSRALRAAVEQRLTELEAARPAAKTRNARTWWRTRLVALAAVAACLVALAVPIVRSLNFFGAAEPTRLAKQEAPATDAPEKLFSNAAKNVVMGSTRKSDSVRAFGTLEKYDLDKSDTLPPGQWNVDPSLEKPATPSPLRDITDLNSSPFRNSDGIVANDDHPIDLETLSGRLMHGVGVNSDAGLVGNVTMDGQSGAGLTMTGSGSLTLNGNNTYTGGTSINASRLALGNGAAVNSNNQFWRLRGIQLHHGDPSH